MELGRQWYVRGGVDRRHLGQDCRVIRMDSNRPFWRRNLCHLRKSVDHPAVVNLGIGSLLRKMARARVSPRNCLRGTWPLAGQGLQSAEFSTRPHITVAKWNDLHG